MKIMLSKALVLAVIVLFIGAGVVPSISSDEPTGNTARDTLTLYPTDDTFISKYPTGADSNHGLSEDLHVRNTYGTGGNDNYKK